MPEDLIWNLKGIYLRMCFKNLNPLTICENQLTHDSSVFFTFF